MDDYTWKKRLQQRRARNRRERMLVLLILIFSLGILLWYFAFYARTPEYAVKQLEQALQEKDIETFREYTNLELLLSDAYDDLTVDLFSHDAELSPQSKILFEKFFVLVKPQIVETATDTISHRISDEVWLLPEGTDLLKGRQLGVDYEQFLERSLLKSTTIRGVSSITRRDHTAILMLDVTEEFSQTPFTLELLLEKGNDGPWRVTSIKNYRSYLETVYPMLYKDIKQYIEATAEINSEYNHKLQMQQWDFQYRSHSSGGQLSKDQRMNIASYLEDNVIPTVKKRQAELDQIEIPPGALHLSALRKESTDLSIRIWQHYIHGLREDNISEFHTAESLHKQMLATEQRIEDIIHHAAVTKEAPEIP